MSQAFSQSNILSEFRKTGIHPYNPDIFTDEDFLCSAVTVREMIDERPEQDVFSIVLSSVTAELPSDVTMIAMPEDRLKLYYYYVACFLIKFLYLIIICYIYFT